MIRQNGGSCDSQDDQKVLAVNQKAWAIPQLTILRFLGSLERACSMEVFTTSFRFTLISFL